MKGSIRLFPKIVFPKIVTMIAAGLIVFSAACSSIPKEVREEAVDVPFETLVQNTEQYTSRTVILGGYIEQIRVTGEETRFVVLQAPLGMFDQPKSKQASEGRFLAIHEGLLGREGYGVGQDITIVGMVLGKQVPEFGYYADRMLAIEALKIYRWHYGHIDEYCDSPINGENFPEYEEGGNQPQR